LNTIELSQFFLKLPNLLFLFLNYPNNFVSTLTFRKGGAISQSADTADADADEDVNVVLDSLCFSCPLTIVDEQCKVILIVGVLILKKMKSCVAYLWLTQSFLTNVHMACLDLK
jgi:hypothetical protein